MPGKRFSPVALAEIASAALDGSETATQVARRLGLEPAGVSYNYRRFRREGWYTPLGSAPCSGCGQTVYGPPRAVLHDRCQQDAINARRRERRADGQIPVSTPYVRRWRQIRPEQAADLREREKAKQRAAYHDLPGSEQAAILARAHQHDQAAYPLTLDAANNRGEVWTPEEDEYVRTHPRMPARDVALKLGRTLWAVRSRRVKLRRDAAERRNQT